MTGRRRLAYERLHSSIWSRTTPTDPEQQFRAPISDDDALKAIAVGMVVAKEQNLSLSLVVVDPAGHLVAAGRVVGGVG